MVQSALEKGPERSALTAHLGEVISPEQSREEFLGQILRVLGRTAPAAHIGVNGVPVRLAEVFKGLSGSRRVPAAGSQHDAPVGGGELGVLARSCWRGVCGPNHEARARCTGMVSSGRPGPDKQVGRVLWPMGTIR